MEFKWTLILGLVTLATACGLKPSSRSSQLDPAAVVNPTFSSISAVILQPGCVGCHGGSGGYSFDSYASTLSAVSPGNPGGSALYLSVSSGRMPQGGPALSAAQLAAVSTWIQQGAKND